MSHKLPILDCLSYKHIASVFKAANITSRLEALYFLSESYGTVKPFMFDFVTRAYENGILKE